MTEPLVYTLALTPRARDFCDVMAKHGLSMRHFDTEVELVRALDEQPAAAVEIHGTKEEARALEARLRELSGCAKLRVGTLGKFDARHIFDDDDDIGTAAAAMTVFDTMPELSDNDQWMKRPI